MQQDIDGRTDQKTRETIGTDAGRLSFVDQRSARMFGGEGNRRSFSVIERFKRCTDSELAEKPCRVFAKSGDLDKSADHEFIQAG